MTTTEIVCAVVAALGSGTVLGSVAGFKLGRRAAELDLETRLQEDPDFRRDTLEQLAQLAGAKVEMTE